MNNGYYKNFLSWKINGIENHNFNDGAIRFEWRLSKKNLNNPTFLEACLDAAEQCKLAADVLNKPIGLAISGGMDSQFIALCLLRVGAKFTAHIMEFIDGINREDVECAQQFCMDNNIPYIIHNIDIIKFMEFEGIKIATMYGVSSPQYAAHFWLAMQMKEFFIIFGGGDCTNLTVKNGIFDSKNIYNNFEEVITSASTSLARLMIDQKIDGAAAFYRYTPDIKYALFTDPLTLCWMKQIKSMPGAMLRYMYLKYMLYETAMPGKLFGRKKLTGFERIEHFDYKVMRPRYIDLTKHLIFTLPVTVEKEMSYYTANCDEYLEFYLG